MYMDNDLFIMKVAGRPGDSTAWSSLWAATTNTSDSIDLGLTVNRSIAEGGYVVWRQDTAAAVAAGGTTTISLICSAAATLGSATLLHTKAWTHDECEAAFTKDTIVFAWKIPQNIPLRYLGVQWVLAVGAWTAGTADIFITRDVPTALR